MDLTGIHNDNEFYTDHYLHALLEGDLKDVIRGWRARGKEDEAYRPPYTRLRNLNRLYFQLRQQLEREKDPERRRRLGRRLLAQLLPALGYDYTPAVKALDDGFELPLLAEVRKPNGAPLLWVLEAVEPHGEEAVDLLETSPATPPSLRDTSPSRGGFLRNVKESGLPPEHTSVLPSQGRWPEGPEGSDLETYAALIARHIFPQPEPPRWLLLAGFTQLVLIDRHKWNEKRALRFDLAEILGRREPSTLQAMAALLHRDHTCPPDGLALLDTLDENSHKHAFAVSEDLKYALREAIELIGNEAVWHLREVRKKGVFTGEEKLDADQLTRECLRYMYRLLFLFYIEARPELGYAPMNAGAYLKGYSLESLRDLEMVRLTTDEARNGYYLHASIEQLFRLVFEGYAPAKQRDAFGRDTFAIPPLKSHLFDEERTPTLNRIKFRNHVLQRVIRLMSLSDPKRTGRGGRGAPGRLHRRGRISYAQLGINQLGAVYEALLSYRGFFAEHNLYEVKPAKEKYDELKQAYFVREEDLKKYDREKEWVYADKKPRVHEKGRFIYRLAGRDRQNSASYYTPEVLTQCLVKYALKELIGDDETGTPADDILHLTICEPAMGSAAFLNEAVDQLADAYMRRKQKELGDALAPDAYAGHKQKVKMFLADNNVFGVDLNPVAVELAEVSLWLNTIHPGGFVPWFGLQLVCGNSLVGARRQTYDTALLPQNGRARRDAPPVRLHPPGRLYHETAPDDTPMSEPRPANTVYHFLLPDPGMANYNDKVIKSLAADEIKAIKAWQKAFVRAPFAPGEILTLQRLSDAIDALWAAHAKQMHDIRVRTTDQLVIYGGQGYKTDSVKTTREKDAILQQEMFSEGVRNSSPYRRLRLAMDYWCALWFWPIEQAHLLPARSEYLQDLLLILEGEDYAEQPAAQTTLFPAAPPPQLALELKDAMGFVDLDRLVDETPRLQTVRALRRRYRFLHWELEFADLFAYKGGFDLVLGNPPWIKVEWNEGGVMGDAEPRFAIQKFSAAKLAKLREEVLDEHDLRSAYLAAFEAADAMQKYLNAYPNYPLLKGQQTNLYKCFLPVAWRLGSNSGVSAFLHPEWVYDDPKGGVFRETIYERLTGHFQFINELQLFAEVDHHTRFSINLFSNELIDRVRFAQMANLYHPPTIDVCFERDGSGPVPGIKDDENNWNVHGHPERVVDVDEEALAMFVQLYDMEGTPALQARLPAVHSTQIVKVLRKFADQPKRLGDLKGDYISMEMWHETNAQKDETIKQQNHFPTGSDQWVLSGPHFYVGTPLNKSPRDPYTSNLSYDVIDLTQIPAGYLPRTLYTPACSPEEYRERTPAVPWDDGKKVTDYYRFVARAMLSQSGERTLCGAIMTPQSTHIHTCFSLAFKSIRNLILFSAGFHSLPVDFFVKSTGKAFAGPAFIAQFPVMEFVAFESDAILRTLLLNCLTTHYADLWRECWDPAFTQDRWTKDDPCLPNGHFEDLTGEWAWETPLRTDYARRQALVELDVLAAMALGLTLEELQTIYRVQFPVLRWNDRNTFYDREGRIVYTVSKGLPGVGFSTKEWKSIKDMKEGTVERTITDDTMPGGPVERTIVYRAPFDGVDRETDYARAWAAFASHP